MRDKTFAKHFVRSDEVLCYQGGGQSVRVVTEWSEVCGTSLWLMVRTSNLAHDDGAVDIEFGRRSNLQGSGWRQAWSALKVDQRTEGRRHA